MTLACQHVDNIYIFVSPGGNSKSAEDKHTLLSYILLYSPLNLNSYLYVHLILDFKLILLLEREDMSSVCAV